MNLTNALVSEFAKQHLNLGVMETTKKSKFRRWISLDSDYLYSLSRILAVIFITTIGHLTYGFPHTMVVFMLALILVGVEAIHEQISKNRKN